MKKIFYFLSLVISFTCILWNALPNVLSAHNLPLVTIPIIGVVLSLIFTTCFFSFDRSELNKMTRPFFTDYKEIHNGIYIFILLLTVAALVAAFNKEYRIYSFIYYFSVAVYCLTLILSLYLRYKENIAYGLVMAISWMIAVLPIAGTYLVLGNSKLEILTKIVLILAYEVFFYIGVRKQ